MLFTGPGRKPVYSVGEMRETPRLTGALAFAAGIWMVCQPAAADVTPDRVLLLYNSQNAESQAVRDLYIAAHPGVLEFDLNDTALGTGNISRAVYESQIRAPLLTFLNDGAAPIPTSQQVIAIATTRGLPARIAGTPGLEFSITSDFASFECELSLVQQDLSLPGEAGEAFDFRYSSLIDNPYHGSVGVPIDSFSRAQIETVRTDANFDVIQNAGWSIDDLTPGDFYLVCRLDAAPDPVARGANTAIDNIAALISRSQNLTLTPCKTQVLLDEYSCTDQLDDDGLGALLPARDDYDQTVAVLTPAGFSSILHDETSEFFEQFELPDQTSPLAVIGTYGENHRISGMCGESPPGAGVYISTYTHVHPAGVFLSIESFNGNSIINGAIRGNQGQALDFIAAGGSFTIATVAEPFTVGVASLEYLTENLYLNHMTYAEAAYAAVPFLSWQSTPVGDPLAKVGVVGVTPSDLNGDGVVSSFDLALLLGAWGTDDCAADLNGDGIVGAVDFAILLGSWG